MDIRRIVKHLLLVIAVLVPLSFALVACDDQVTQPTSSQDTAQNRQSTLWTYVNGKLRPITDSAELENIVERTNRENNPNHVWYIYLFTLDGKLIFYHALKGKLSSTDSNAVPNTRIDCQNPSPNTFACGTVDNPQLDGSYGANEPGVFGFLSGSNSMIESNFYYFISDQFIPLTQQPVLNLQQNGK